VRVLALIRRPRRSFVALGVAVGTVFLLGVTSAVANLPGSTFEGSDGNLVVNTPGNTDWDNAPNLSVGVDLPSGANDNSFGNGTHEAETSVTVVDGSIPNSKADLARFAVASEFASGSNYLYLAWSRENASGSVNYDFEINRETQPNMTTLGPKTLVRTAGDLLISYAFQGNTLTPTLSLRTWNGTVWGAEQPLTGSSEGAGNAVAVSENLGGNPAVNRPAGQFGEAAINLTAAGVFPPGTCKGFGSAYVKSRASQSFTSEIKDFIAPIAVNISNCGGLIVKKVTVPSPDPTNTAFAFAETGPGGFTDSFSLHNGEQDENQNLQVGTYTASETVPANWSLTSATCDNGNDPSAITITPDVTVTCTFTNTLQLGAITVTKLAKHAASGPGDHPLAGVSFTVEGVTKQTGADGTACFDGLSIGNHDVTETLPSGYASDDASLTKGVNVDNAATCAGGGGEAVSFHNTPLTDLSISVNSQVDGGTASTITCDNGGPNGSTGANGDGSASASNLRPGTYNCTIVVDP
jgi:hypothetical protein